MELLTKELQRKLLSSGFRYVLIKDVCNADPAVVSCVLQPAHDIPAIQMYSCTSLEDGMINDIIENRVQHVRLYINGRHEGK